MAFKKTTPEEFEKELQSIIEEWHGDMEMSHRFMDDVLCRVLTENGYWKGVQVFKSQHKWYA